MGTSAERRQSTPSSSLLAMEERPGKGISSHGHLRNTFDMFSRPEDFVEMFLANRRASGCSVCTLEVYGRNLRQFEQVADNTFEGRRNRALIALLVDSGLRISEALRLRIADVDFAAMMLTVRGGKGNKDSVGYFDFDTVNAIRQWFKVRRGLVADDYVFVDRNGRPLSRSHATHT